MAKTDYRKVRKRVACHAESAVDGPTLAGVQTRARLLTSLGSIFALLALALPAQAQWKWRDANGSVQFSDRPPPMSVPDRDILQRPARPAAATATQASTAGAAASAAVSAGAAGAAPASATSAKPGAAPADAELERRRKAEEAEKSAKSKAEEERRKATQADNCARARGAIATFESGQRISRVNEKGEREFLDDRQRNDELRRAREVAGSECR